MHCQCFDGIELALQAFVVERCMHMGVAWPAQQRDPVLYVAAVEVPLVAPIPVACLGDQVVAGEFPDLSPTQLTGAPATYSATVLHASQKA